MLELYGSSSCPFTTELREQLEWDKRDYVEYDVDVDSVARARLHQMTPISAVPTLVENGAVVQIGWQGRSCSIGSASPRS
ncbi:MAG TPA: glutaredoxin [Candidatus Acidoferrum sp.]|nr:glutaredoxin [Candidatus Acidoferrum sp.]